MYTDYFKTIFWILFDLIEKSNKSKDLGQTTSLIADAIRELKEKNILKDENEWRNGGQQPPIDKSNLGGKQNATKKAR